MARKPENDNAPPPAKTAAALKALRSTIDKLDLQILELVNKRAALAAEIGKVKNDHGTEIFAPAREEEVYK
ncbi:MAG TPA: chorismate mutase, partial [Gemmataceae bacterium]|nr:chorismate mutase [Gemmataceae bacterium]